MVSRSHCPFCGGQIFKQLSTIQVEAFHYDVVICKNCQGCFRLQKWDSDFLIHYYNNLSRLHRGKKDDQRENLFEDRVKEHAYPRYYFLKNFFKLRSEQDLICELGSYDGANLLPWKNAGFDVLGFECDETVKEFSNRMGIAATSQKLIEYNFSKKKPSLFILSHVLEHLEDVDTYLTYILKNMGPQGWIFIEVPGVRLQGFSNLTNYFDVEHIFHFELKSLINLLKKNGFSVTYGDEYIRCIAHPTLECEKRVQRGLLGKALSVLAIPNMPLENYLTVNGVMKLPILFLHKLQTLLVRYYYGWLVFCGKRSVKA
ncbi:MAG: methyltransferase domain-containing protein [Deltaproteobacteria bacterium]|nr:methyltransferase domain-containing protein [Deltaproteobacteria bacterium]